MQRRYVTTDVFTDRAFGGNPLAVVLDAEGLSPAQMQAIAREFNYSETTFVLPPANPAHTAQVRIFTPAAEMPFAGHPNVGTAVVLARRTPGLTHVVFEEAAGLVPLVIEHAAGMAIGAELQAPVAFARGPAAAVDEAAAAVGLAEADVSLLTHLPSTASAGLPFLFVNLASRDALRRARPEAARLPALLQATAAAGLFVYTQDMPPQGCDVAARMFFPLDSIIEDPATGSANVALAGLLASCRAEADYHLILHVAQGDDMGRPSRLRARAEKIGGWVMSTHVGGQCVMMMEGTLAV